MYDSLLQISVKSNFCGKGNFNAENDSEKIILQSYMNIVDIHGIAFS